MNKKWAISAGVSVLVCLSTPAFAFTSQWNGLGAVGLFQGWRVEYPNLMLVADYTWQGEFYITNNWNDFKFVANGAWATSWRETNQTVFTVPITGRVDQLSSTGGCNIVMSNCVPGLYQFTFYEKTSNYTIRLLYTNGSAVNILTVTTNNNCSFEVAGGDSTQAKYWQWGNKDYHANKWGNAERRDWRGHSGSYNASIHGYWMGSDYGGWWREGPAVPGVTYQASAWFWADDRSGCIFTAANIELKIEFFDSNTNIINYVSTNFTDIVDEKWWKKTVRMTAPEDTAWARLVFDATQTGPQGALQVDDVELRAYSARSQDFSLWGGLYNDGTYTLDDWTISTAKVTPTNARATYAASLPWSTGSTNYILTPFLEGGIGTISFWYRHGTADTNNSPTGTVSIAVQKSASGTNWITISTITNIVETSYRLWTKYVYDTTSYYVRIVHAGPTTNRVLIDDIAIAEPEGIPRYMDFNDWPDEGTNFGPSSFLEWDVTNGIVSSVNAYAGRSALLPGDAAFSNAVRSPFYAAGYGTISFKYCRGTNGSGATQFRLESSPDSTNWTLIAGLSNIQDTAYQTYSKYFYVTNASYLRIANVTNPPVLDPTTLIDEGFAGGAAAPLGWTFSGITDTYESDAYSGRAIPAIKFDDSNDYIRTPPIVNPTNLSFWLRGYSTGTYSNQFIVERAIAGIWTTITNISPLPTSETTYSFVLPTSVTNLRFTYYKASGNAAFDDVIVQGEPTGVDQPPQDLLIDDVHIEYPSLARSHNFNSWPTEDSYGDYEYQGWTVYDGLIDNEGAYSGQSAILDDSPASGQYIKSPYMPEGIGSVTFLYSRWTNDPVHAYVNIELSSNGLTWVTNDTLDITSTTNYLSYGEYIYDTTNHYVRLYHLSGGDRIKIDNITIGTPSPRPNVILNAWHSPSTPFTNDAVSIWASVSLQYGATVAAVTTFYRIGTSGIWSSMGMQVSNRINYVTTNAIPPQNPGTTVQYYVECRFGGIGSELTSPRYYPEGGWTNPLSYCVPRKPSGYVWINEFNYVNDSWDTSTDTNEFIEICGPAEWDISGWTIELYIDLSQSYTGSVYSLYATYTIPHGTILSNDASGYGFFVLADDNPLLVKDITFTHTNLFDGTQLADGVGMGPSGIRLFNEGHGIEHAVSYEGPLSGFTRCWVSDDGWDVLDPYGVSMTGTGSYYTSFAWQTNGMTPGAINIGQVLTNAPTGEPDILVLGTNGAAITNGDVTPITADGTDFGSNTVSSGYTDHTFAITNAGSGILHVSGVSTSGTQAADFLLVSVPDSSIDAGQTTTFNIRFTPSGLGTRNATLHVTSDDTDDGDYTFAVTGNGYELESPPAEVVFSRMRRQTNELILTLQGNTNNWDVTPFWTTNLGRGPLFTQNWQIVDTYTNTFDAGTTATIIRFNLPTGGMYIYRALVTRP